MLPPVLSNRASDVMGLEVRQRGHGATQPQTFPSAWDLTLCPGKLLPGLPPWCIGERVTFSLDLGSLTGSSDDPNPATRLFAATSELVRLSLADVEL